ncbi:hypothetical protein BKA69DRAFT_1091896 [Paraphysoderma sedebokerense]|nr:hypothetical protein BKA69DRAFT_1091896 [Paraphysoderma sedebokerense]
MDPNTIRAEKKSTSPIPEFHHNKTDWTKDLSLSALPPLPYKVLSRPPPTSPNLQIHRQDTTTIYYKEALPKSKRESEITSSHVKPDTLNKDGILPLINRGYFHPSLDFTPAFRVASTSPPLLSQQIQCHPSDRRYDRRSYLEKFKIDESLRWKFNVTNHAGENLDLKSTVDTDQNQFADDLERLTKTPFPSISNLNDGEDACGEGAEKTIILHIVSSRTLRDHPAFQVFAERCPSTLWDSVLSLLSLLEEMALQYSLPLIMVDSEALVKMASKPAKANYSISDLLTSCVNHNQLISLMKQPGRLFLASNKHRRRDAALKIQKCWRGYVQRKIYLHNADLKNAARVVVEFRKRCLARRAWLKQQAQQRQRYFELCDMMLESFKQNWGILQNTNRRLHIHLPSFSHPLRIRPNFKDPSFLQQMQIGRLYELVHNPKMECIYITQQRFKNEFDTLPGSSAHNDETIEDEWWELVKSYLRNKASLANSQSIVLGI